MGADQEAFLAFQIVSTAKNGCIWMQPVETSRPGQKEAERSSLHGFSSLHWTLRAGVENPTTPLGYLILSYLVLSLETARDEPLLCGCIHCFPLCPSFVCPSNNFARPSDGTNVTHLDLTSDNNTRAFPCRLFRLNIRVSYRPERFTRIFDARYLAHWALFPQTFRTPSPVENRQAHHRHDGRGD